MVVKPNFHDKYAYDGTKDGPLRCSFQQNKAIFWNAQGVIQLLNAVDESRIN